VESAAGPPGARRAVGTTPRGGALSSAILYVAIVVIWAAVLIPRWLRRDSSSSSGERAGDDLTTAEPDSAAVAEPAPRSRRREDPAPAPRPEAPEARREVPGGGSRGQEHKGVLTARRRLLGLLVALAVGSGALAVTKLAAWWVVVPPSVMLLGYVAMLREAGRADAERQEPARTRAAEAAPAPSPVVIRPAQVRPA
jgi:hypothetical protein